MLLELQQEIALLQQREQQQLVPLLQQVLQQLRSLYKDQLQQAATLREKQIELTGICPITNQARQTLNPKP